MKHHRTSIWKTPAVLLTAAILTAVGPSTSRAAGVAVCATEGNTWDIRFVSSYSEFCASENYLSGPDFEVGTAGPAAAVAPSDLWHANYDDPDGWLYGFSGVVAPGFLGGAVIDFGYRTGDLKGGFTTTPAAGGEVYAGRADIDTDIWEIGVSYPFACGLYGRVGYYNREDDVDWKYDDGDLERQKYESERVEVGVGAIQSFPLGDSGLVLLLDEFVGALYYDIEHKEVDGGLTTDWSDWTYVLRAGAGLQYPLNQTLNVVGSVAYEYIEIDDGGLDREETELMLSLGLSGNF